MAIAVVGALGTALAAVLKAPSEIIVSAAVVSAALTLASQFVWPAFVAGRDLRRAREERWGAAADPWPWSGNDEVGEIGLLDARQAVVKFRRRGLERGDLLSWCADPDASPIHLITGPAGVGKTRLAVQLAEELLAEDGGWVVAAAYPGTEADAVSAALELGCPVLVVIDQADTRADLAPALRELPRTRNGRAVRILLVARSDFSGQWWTRLLHNVQRDQSPWALQNAGHTHLEHLGDTRDAQVQLFDKAVDALAHQLGIRKPAVRMGHTAPTASFLMIHAAALVSVLRARAGGSDHEVDIDDTLWEMLFRHESSGWQAAQSTLGVRLQPGTQRQIVAFAALWGAADEQSAVDMLVRVPALRDKDREERRTVAAWLHMLYPGNPAQWIGTVEPQQLAEQLLLAEATSDDEFASALLTDVPADRMTRVLTLLGGAAATRPWAREQIVRLLRTQPADTLPAACAVTFRHLNLDELIADRFMDTSPPLPASLVERIWQELPAPEDTVRLSRTVTSVARLRLHAATADTAAQADRLYQLARALRFRYDYSSAADNAWDAAVLWRSLPHQDESSRRGLADTLIVLAAVDTPPRTRPDVVAAEAVDLSRSLAESNRPADLAHLTHTLAAYAHALHQVDRTGEAVAVAEEAVALSDRLVAADPLAYDPSLARAHCALGTALQQVASDQAREAAGLAADRYRSLASADPDRYERRLAHALSLLAHALGHLKRWPLAIAAGEEGIELLEALHDADPIRFGGDLATGLADQAISRTCAGQVAGTEAAARRAIRLLRSPATAGLHHLDKRLSGGYRALAQILFDADQTHPAVDAAEQAVALCRSSGDADTDRHDLADTLEIYAKTLLAAGRDGDAIRAAEEAVRLLLVLVEIGPESSERCLARTYFNLSHMVARIDGKDAAIGPARESVRRWTAVVNRQPYQVWRDGLAEAHGWLNLITPGEAAHRDEVRS